MEKSNREKLIARAVNALENMYHNATPNYPTCRNDAEADAFQSWFEFMASFEIDELNSGGAYGNSDPEFDNLKSERAREFARCQYHNDKVYDQARGGRYELITEYGKLYQYGRGGRTLAPEDLIKTLGGSNFTINTDIIEDMNAENLTDLVLTVEAFNRYVESWNKDVPAMWNDAKEANDWNFEKYDGKIRKKRTIVEYV